MPEITDRTHPDYVWPKDSYVASGDDLTDVIAHLKNWVTRAIGGDAAKLATLQAEVAQQQAEETKLAADLAPPAAPPTPAEPPHA